MSLGVRKAFPDSHKNDEDGYFKDNISDSFRPQAVIKYKAHFLYII